MGVYDDDEAARASWLGMGMGERRLVARRLGVLGVAARRGRIASRARDRIVGGG